MLSLDELRLLQNAGVSIGAHGASHLPLPEIADPASDLQRARDWLSPVSRTAAMSFPHGRYDAAVANVARGFGYRLLFTSDPVLNRCPMGWLQSDVVGRIVLGASISVDQSPPRAPQLAAWLYLRRRHALAA
jgi:peptidoglycan/xylan/chitin deacetylase (PgdA/CDA1 family)